MDDTRSVVSTHSDGSQQTTLTTQTTKPRTSRIPVRLTRAQRLANEKRREQREKRENAEQAKEVAKKRISKPRPRLSTRNIYYKTPMQTEYNTNDISLSSLIPDISRIDHWRLEPNESTEQIRKRLLSQSRVQELLRQMIDDFVSICSTSHYVKVDGLYIKQDSEKTWNAKEIDDIPLACEEGRENWIERKKKVYPLVLTDLLARGCFQQDLPSSFPSIEVFRNSYISPKTARRSLLEGYTVWELFGSPAFSFKVMKDLQCNKIQIEYHEQKVKCAMAECLQGNNDWGYIFWHLGKDALKFVRISST